MIDNHPILCIIIGTLFLLGIIAVPVYLWDTYEEREMQSLHCVQTGQNKTDLIMMPVTTIVGKVTIVNMIPTYVTSYEYKCDDGMRWR